MLGKENFEGSNNRDKKLDEIADNLHFNINYIEDVWKKIIKPEHFTNEELIKLGNKTNKLSFWEMILKNNDSFTKEELIEISNKTDSNQTDSREKIALYIVDYHSDKFTGEELFEVGKT